AAGGGFRVVVDGRVGDCRQRPRRDESARGVVERRDRAAGAVGRGVLGDEIAVQSQLAAVSRLVLNGAARTPEVVGLIEVAAKPHRHARQGGVQRLGGGQGGVTVYDE